MRIDILTLFPDNMDRMLHESILGRACRKGLLDLHCVQIRDYTENRQNQVDDYPYGGGFGCIMMAQPLKSCVEAVLARGEIPREKTCVIAMTPQGTPFRQETARRLQRVDPLRVHLNGAKRRIELRYRRAQRRSVCHPSRKAPRLHGYIFRGRGTSASCC